MERNTICESIHARRFWIVSANIFISLDRKRDAITVNAARAPYINGRRVNSCLCFAAMHQGDDITTIEGLGEPENLHAMQAAFVAHDAYQCGYCTSGQIMSAVALLKEPCGPDDVEVKEFMSGNICRCGAYQNIVSAIQSVRQNAKTQKPA